MATTTYTITVQNVDGEFEVVGTKSKRGTAIDLAEQTKAERKATTQVHTGAGTLVAEFKARKPQKRTRPFTRDVLAETVVWLPEGYVIPEGKRVAYTRKQKGCGILHDFEEQYWVYDLLQGELLGTFSTTRQCGRFLADSVTLVEGKVLVSE